MLQSIVWLWRPAVYHICRCCKMLLKPKGCLILINVFIMVRILQKYELDYCLVWPNSGEDNQRILFVRQCLIQTFILIWLKLGHWCPCKHGDCYICITVIGWKDWYTVGSKYKSLFWSYKSIDLKWRITVMSYIPQQLFRALLKFYNDTCVSHFLDLSIIFDVYEENSGNPDQHYFNVIQTWLQQQEALTLEHFRLSWTTISGKHDRLSKNVYYFWLDCSSSSQPYIVGLRVSC